MTRTEILELAKHADIQDAWFRTPHPGVVAQLERFANLVAAKEREGCAAACDNEKWDHQTGVTASKQSGVGHDQPDPLTTNHYDDCATGS